MSLHLAAFAINCKSEEEAEMCFVIAEQDHDGNWRMTYTDRVIHPFWTCELEVLCDDNPINLPTKIPEGWVKHIQEIAAKSVAQCREPEVSLAQRLGLLHKTVDPTIRRL